MLIHRSKPGKRFTQIPNETLRDRRLSYRARGVLCELLSRPDDWDTTADRMSQAGVARGAGREAMRTVFAELEAAGYLVRIRKRGSSGRISTELHLYDRPVSAGDTGKPETRTPAPAEDTGIATGGTEVPESRTSADWASKQRPSTNTKNEDGRNDLASRRARAKAASAKRTVGSVIADVRSAAASAYGQADADGLSDGHALALYFHHAHRTGITDLVAYMMKIFGDGAYLDTFIANAGWCCPQCRNWEDECACAA